MQIHQWPPYDQTRDIKALERRVKQLETHAKGSEWYDFAVEWTSTGTAPAFGTGGNSVGHYQRIGRTCIYVMDVTFTGTTTFGTGQYSWTVPFFPSQVFGFVGVAHINTSGGTRYGGQVPLFSGNTFSIFFPTAGSPSTLSAMTNTVPVTIASGDRLRAQITYQVDEGT